jgi:hypothetical protein
MRNKPRTLPQYIQYRNTLVTRRAARQKHGLKPLSGREDYYTIRIRELDEQHPEFKGMGQVNLKGVL